MRIQENHGDRKSADFASIEAMRNGLTQKSLGGKNQICTFVV